MRYALFLISVQKNILTVKMRIMVHGQLKRTKQVHEARIW